VKILWLTNIPLPEASILMNENSTPFGGWLVNASKALTENNKIELSIAFPNKGSADIRVFYGKDMKYYAFTPVNENNRNHVEKNKNLEKILDEVNPDIVHIYGTEYSHTLAMVNACKKRTIHTVISIQGLVSVYARHYMACLPPKVQGRFTFRDFIKQDNLKQQQNNFVKRGKFEIEAINKVKHVIGRTSWDRACVAQINPNSVYHFCNETLRDEFYNYEWDINQCEKHSIFVSQGMYPIKGLHFMIEAMPTILKYYPDAMLNIGGFDITKYNTIKDKLKISSYGKYIRDLIEKKNLQNRVVFTGVLNAKEMCEKYLKSNIFVCPSSIENSPNSLGEAMILGVPSVASHVGGVADLITDGKEGFIYQMDAPYMLAHYICEIFKNNELALEFSKNAKEHAKKTHHIEANNNRLINIYLNILSNK
jgi:glycosyltransferase involved in cell wall biosynthesis